MGIQVNRFLGPNRIGARIVRAIIIFIIKLEHTSHINIYGHDPRRNLHFHILVCREPHGFHAGDSWSLS